jgi:hypothetical protein
MAHISSRSREGLLEAVASRSRPASDFLFPAVPFRFAAVGVFFVFFFSAIFDSIAAFRFAADSCFSAPARPHADYASNAYATTSAPSAHV